MDNPTYEHVCSGRTGHTEAIELTYNPDEASSEHVMHQPCAYTSKMNLAGRAHHMCTMMLLALSPGALS